MTKKLAKEQADAIMRRFLCWLGFHRWAKDYQMKRVHGINGKYCIYCKEVWFGD
jgi:hypothetical protein